MNTYADELSLYIGQTGQLSRDTRRDAYHFVFGPRHIGGLNTDILENVGEDYVSVRDNNGGRRCIPLNLFVLYEAV
jgi:hypothetical protein